MAMTFWKYCSVVIKKYLLESEKITYYKKKKRRLQWKISRKYLINKKGDSYCKTSNLIKIYTLKKE